MPTRRGTIPSRYSKSLDFYEPLQGTYRPVMAETIEYLSEEEQAMVARWIAEAEAEAEAANEAPQSAEELAKAARWPKK